MPDYSRFHVSQTHGQFSLLDQSCGWVWKDIKKYKSVLAMMNFILENELQFKDEEYKRLRRLDGNEWEAELK
jgi:hypothetical protein